MSPPGPRAYNGKFADAYARDLEPEDQQTELVLAVGFLMGAGFYATASSVAHATEALHPGLVWPWSEKLEKPA